MRTLLNRTGAWLLGVLALLAGPVMALPRIIRFSEHPWVVRGHAKVVAGGDGGAGFWAAFARGWSGAALTMAVVLLLVGAWALMGHDGAGGLLLATTPVVALPKDLKTLLTEVEKIQADHKGKPMPPEVAERWESLMAEGKRIQDEHDRETQAKGLRDFSRQVPGGGVLPADDQDEPAPKAGKGSRHGVAGYISLGDLVVRSEGLQTFLAKGMPRGQALLASAPVAELVERGKGQMMVPLTKEGRQALEAFEAKLASDAVAEGKAVPTLGTGIIEAERLSEVVRVTEQEQVDLLDVLNVSRTSSDAVTYPRIESYTRAAAPVAVGVAKPESTLEMAMITEAVRTMAVWMPVHDRQLSDYPQLRNIIDVELLYDLKKLLEEEVMYGDGTGEHFEGIVDHPSVQAARTEGGDTLIDIIRRGITDVRRAGYAPNAVVLDPLDWEEIELEKGSDQRYVWAVIRDTLGPRIWSLRVVETTGAEANEGNATERRNLVVGDFVRGATLWMREAPSVSVGWINDQFTKNMRTLLAEQRAAFGVKRPGAFRVHETEAAVS